MFWDIKTDRLILRPLNINDLDTLHAYASDASSTRYMICLPNDTREETEKFLTEVIEEWQKNEPCFFEFAITLDEKHIGSVSVYLNEQRTEGEFGWILNKDYCGKGYATEAAMAIKNFAIYKFKVSKLFARCDFRNIASCNVMKKIGLTLECDTEMRQYPKTLETAKELMYSISII